MKRLVLALGILVLATAATATAGDAGGFGLGAGIVKVKDVDGSNLWLTANMRTMLAANLALEPEIGWYRESADDDHMDAFNGGGSLLFVFPTEKAALFAGAGLGAHMFRYSLGWSSSTETKLGYHGLAGADLYASPSISLFGAIRYEIIKFDSENLKQWKLYGGLRFRSH